jgi:hypothetical protein
MAVKGPGDEEIRRLEAHAKSGHVLAARDRAVEEGPGRAAAERGRG